VKLILDSGKIYNKEFSGAKPGYDSMQVDTFLDLVIKDYQTFEAYEASSEKQIHELEMKVKLLNRQLSDLAAENEALKNKLNGISSNPDAGLNNLEFLKRISKLEVALKKAGIDPTTVE